MTNVPSRHTRFPLTLSALTLRTASFAERLDAAARAGFTGIGLSVEQYLRAVTEEGWTDRDMAAGLRNHGLALTEVELLKHWADGGRPDHDDTAFHIAGTFGVPRINAGMFDECTWHELAEGYRAACRRAEETGTLLALEFMPFSGIRSLGLADRLVTCADSPSAGLVLDAWHLARGRTPFQELETLDPGRVLNLQLSDVLPDPLDDTLHEARHQRQLPGEGTADLTGLLGLLHRTGVRAPVSVEVLSDALDARTPSETAARAHRTACTVLNQARQSAAGSRDGRRSPAA